MLKKEKNIVIFFILILSLGLFFLSFNKYSFYRSFIEISTKNDRNLSLKINETYKFDKININTANINSLVLLPGIGREIALRIVEYRTENGNFKATKDLLKVKGIGTKKLETMKKYIKIGL